MNVAAYPQRVTAVGSRRALGASAVALVVFALAACSVAAASRAPAAMRVRQRPQTIPALRVWVPAARGTWRLAHGASVIVDGSDRSSLSWEARQLALDLRAMTKQRIVVRFDVRARRGDIVLRRSRRDRRLGAEGYRLTIGRAVTISAATRSGIFYGGRTLLQFVHGRKPVPCGKAHDWPRYPQRGLTVDASRTVYPVWWIKAEIRQLAYLKLNLLHLHLTDDQRWGVASSTHPEIVSPHAFSRAQVRTILRYASRYHVQVVPEVDMPGHMSALLAKHPDLALKAAGTVGSNSPSQYVSGKLDITNPAALRLVRQLLDEYLPLFPGRYWDMGDDEYMSPSEYPLYPQLAAYAVEKYGPHASIADAIHGFINWVDMIARSHGKLLRVWNDQLAGTSVVPVNRDVVVDWWINTSPFGDPVTVSPAALIAEGHEVLNAGWFPTYYATDIGPIAGKSNMQQAYQDWQVNQFEGPESTSDMMQPPQAVPPADRAVLGSTLNVWGPLPETIRQTAAGIAPRLAVIAQKTWGSPPLTPSYQQFQRVIGGVGTAPR